MESCFLVWEVGEIVTKILKQLDILRSWNRSNPQ